MLIRHQTGFPRRSGVAAVELAVLLPFILILMGGLWDVGRMVECSQVLTNACREGGRSAASGRTTDTYGNSLVVKDTGGTVMPNGYPVQTIATYIADAGLDPSNMTIQIDNKTSTTGSYNSTPTFSITSNGVSRNITITSNGTGLTYDKANRLDQLQVTVTLPASNVRWVFIPGFMLPKSYSMGTSASYDSMTDTPITVSSQVMHN